MATGTGTGDTGMYAPCQPPDAWTGQIPAALYSEYPYDPSYDTGLIDLNIGMNGGASWGNPVVIIGATVTAISAGRGETTIMDGRWAWPAQHIDGTTRPGDRVSLAVTGYTSGVLKVSDWSVIQRDRRVAVDPLGPGNASWDRHGAALTHVYGHLDRRSNHDCGNNRLCFVLEHQGASDLVRVSLDNPWDLDVDYQGGLCAELVAPIGYHDGNTGTLSVLEASTGAFMRTWPHP